VLYRRPGCDRARRYLYAWSRLGEQFVDNLRWRCQTCATGDRDVERVGTGLSVARRFPRSHCAPIMRTSIFSTAIARAISARWPWLTSCAWPVTMNAPDTRQGRCLRVLVVDDRLTIRSLIAELLCSNGHEVMEAENGRRAVEILGQHAVDLVITDACMPELGGRGLYEHIEKRHPHLLDKVIVITGHLREDTEFFQTSTRVPILYKPFALDDLSDAVRRVSH